jgi:hypothetical protein
VSQLIIQTFAVLGVGVVAEIDGKLRFRNELSIRNIKGILAWLKCFLRAKTIVPSVNKK